MKKKPLLVINCKTYSKKPATLTQKIGAAILKLKKHYKQVEIILATSPTNLHLTANKISTISQHIDPQEPGAHTGKILAYDLKQNGAKGVLINHSENKDNLKLIEQKIKKTKSMKLTSIVCAQTPAIAKKIASFKPSYIAMEPPQLIGGYISVSTAKPKMIAQTIKKVHEVNPIPVLVGAGVKTTQDVRIAMMLGASGVLVASGVAKAKNYEKALKTLLDGFLLNN